MSLIQTAQAAITASTAALEQLGIHSDPEEETSSSLIHNWPIIAAVSATLVNTITAIAASILGNLPLAITHGVCAVALGILSFHTYMTIDLQTLETYVKIFAKRIQSLAQVALNLSHTTHTLEETQTDLSKELQRRETVFAEVKKDAEVAAKRLEQVTDDLKKNQSHISAMKQILSGSHQMMSEMGSKMAQFVQLNQSVAVSSKDLESQIASIQELEHRFSQSISSLEEEESELASYKKEAEQVAKGLYTQFSQLAAVLLSLRKESETMQSQLKTLKEIDSSLASHTESLKSASLQMGSQAQIAEAFLSKVKEYNQILKTLKEKMIPQ